MSTGKSERHGSIPPPQYRAYRSHIGVLRMLGTDKAMIETAFTVWQDSITLNLDVYLDILAVFGFSVYEEVDKNICESGLQGTEGYTRTAVEKKEAELPGNVAKYINYIATKTDRTPEEEEILERVRKIDEF